MNVIDLGAYRARKTAARDIAAPSTYPQFQPGAVYWFWPMLMWVPVPMMPDAATGWNAS